MRAGVRAMGVVTRIDEPEGRSDGSDDTHRLAQKAGRSGARLGVKDCGADGQGVRKACTGRLLDYVAGTTGA